MLKDSVQVFRSIHTKNLANVERKFTTKHVNPSTVCDERTNRELVRWLSILCGGWERV